MNDKELSEIEARVAKAAAGPWSAHQIKLAKAVSVIHLMEPLLREREWSVRNANENTYCQSCVTVGDRFEDQQGHNPGCKLVEALEAAREVLGQ